jgi:hypothetical protein
VKKTAAREIFTSAAEIVNQALIEGVHNNHAPLPAVSRPENLARAANRYRQKSRPQDPTSLEFEIDTTFIAEDFFRADVKVDDRRHLVFASEKMIQLLSNAKTWYIYMDGTFKLLSIHGFVRSSDELKQVPLVFVLMSGKRKRDYKKVLKAIRRLWILKIPLVFGNVRIMGCSFHWTQCLWRKIQEI